MHSREFPPRLDGVPRTALLLFAWLVPSMAFSDYSVPVDEQTGRIVTRPYLQAAGALPLRFADATPPPDLITRLPAGAPPKLTPLPSATENPQPPPQATAAAESQPAETSDKHPAPAPRAAPPKTSEPEKSAALPPPAILPDETRPKVRPEDFLPFFQFPGAAANDLPSVPEPGRLPPSTATYRQQ